MEIITPKDSVYPQLLREIKGYPKKLYIRGNVELLSNPHLVAVVGSRKALPHSKAAMELLLPPAIRAGAVIVSGLAFGIDALAHQAAVNTGAPTIAVLGSGANDECIYPISNRKLAKQILEGGGTIISEYEPGTPAMPHRFPERNRIVAALCKTTLVIQAATKSGSLITARLAMEYNRDVLAVPGRITDPYSVGTNMLIHEGAGVATSAQDILDSLGISEEAETTAILDHLRPEQIELLKHVSSDAKHVDEISGLVQLPTHQISALLLELELSGQVTHVGGMKFTRK